MTIYSLSFLTLPQPTHTTPMPQIHTHLYPPHWRLEKGTRKQIRSRKCSLGHLLRIRETDFLRKAQSLACTTLGTEILFASSSTVTNTPGDEEGDSIKASCLEIHYAYSWDFLTRKRRKVSKMKPLEVPSLVVNACQTNPPTNNYKLCTNF